MEPEFLYIGWSTLMENGTKHDKIWTAFKMGNAYYAGWGRRDKKLSFKKHDSQHTLAAVQRKKQNSTVRGEKEYNEVDAFQLFTIFPNFKDDVEKHLMMAVLSNKVK